MSEATNLEATFPSKGQAGADPRSIPLEKIDVSDNELWATDSHWPYFERLRNESPVHFCAESEFGPYWSVTTFDEIVTVEKDPETFSSEPNIVIADIPEGSLTQNAGFITMDELRAIRQKTEKNNQNDAVVLSKADLDRIKDATTIKTKDQLLQEKKLAD